MRQMLLRCNNRSISLPNEFMETEELSYLSRLFLLLLGYVALQSGGHLPTFW
jgi:hypothetical protein